MEDELDDFGCVVMEMIKNWSKTLKRMNTVVTGSISVHQLI